MIAPRTLFGKLLLLFLAFGTVMGGVLIFVMRVSHETYHLEFDQMVNRDLAQQYVAAKLLVREPPLTAHNYAASLHRITSINTGIDVYVLDAQGVILAASAPGGRVVQSRVDVGPIKRFLGSRYSIPLLGDNPADPNHRDVFSAARLAIPDCPAAYLYIVLARHDVPSPVAGLKTTYAVGEGIGIIVVALLLAFGGSIAFLRLLTRRLSALQDSVERFAVAGELEEADLAADAGGRPYDEIERLRGHFLELAAQIRAQVLQLRRTDVMRRELVANVSHDLRTPLTTLHAHIETLALNSDLSADERAGSYAIALKQCRRLVRLVEQLLELAKLDGHQVAITPEPFHLLDLAHDVVMKGSLLANRGRVMLKVEQPDTELPLVVGDVALIERVLDNLVENAMRYAGEAGTVTVRVQRSAAGVRLQVHDTGPGISETERARVFDRFYRGDASRSPESGHAGLGLSIARGILELHGRSIDVVSQPEQGTTFSFELPPADSPADTIIARDEGLRERRTASV